ncbi:MAG: serine/threonine protein kinase [Promicromonosporaceae bacterium]|nr:serine/threonine protein kinase [Promicromonosporaceae bacterium]
MVSKRAPAAPPKIAGFEYRELVGSGGFSDVFLYEQQRPRRRVAVKVLLSERTAGQRAAFDAEADLLATLSTHPSIVTMYEAGIAADGRPYLAMEYCPRPNLGARYRTERLTVAEALRISVQIAGAVETAHRAGILHRDIKPANILVTEYGHPVLTDFGISSALDDVRAAEGMSIPWSPPESFQDPPVSGVATDVWALAATTYTLLSGRSPFEVPGGANGSAELVARIERAPLAPTGRDDVPPALERVLATAMSKRPESRYPSVLAFARELQRVQSDLQLAVTPIDLLDEIVRAARDAAPDDDDAPGTRLRPVASIDPSGGAATRFAPREPMATGLEATVHRGATPLAEPADEGTILRSGPATTPADDERVEEGTQNAARTGLAVVIGVVVLAVAVVVVFWAALRNADPGTDNGPGDTPAGATTQQQPQDNLASLVPPVKALTGTVSGTNAVFTWQAPEAKADGDRYAWAQLTLTGDPRYQVVDDLTVTVPLASDGQTCVQVVVVRQGRFSASPQQACVR